MTFFSRNVFGGLVAMLACSATVTAVCPSNSTIAIGTPVANTATGNTQYKIYSNSCGAVQTLQISTSIGVCDTQYFLCAFGTKNIAEYDDPTTGISYICTADTTSESCSGDAVTYCCGYGYITG